MADVTFSALTFRLSFSDTTTTSSEFCLAGIKLHIHFKGLVLQAEVCIPLSSYPINLNSRVNLPAPKSLDQGNGRLHWRYRLSGVPLMTTVVKGSGSACITIGHSAFMTPVPEGVNRLV